ncbi:tRNA pseudouridine synthase 9 [Trypanosoma grayi]|uniref:tRNA pseudouridine synthase 9 n=1 Tax=Trypanosoma grayi TaxID=71804 RepID=UPI0004F4A8A0|nr:tRNA pseudouridine synthase 9 [Trypanosoma grayi]KEG11078.1 tRNA pseudouridine synthase 9 [Trypanosoma grayi]
MDVAQLLRLEEEAWASEAARALYCTPLIPGFPWHTVPGSPPLLLPRRHVVPYHYTFRVFVKGRWIGRALLDVYSEEHAHHTRDYYEVCMQRGRLRRQPRAQRNMRRGCMKRSHGVDDVRGAVEHVEDAAPPAALENGDVVLHTVHRHEIPVSMGATGVDPIVIAAVRIVEYGLLVVHKPAGIPTHAGGRYFMNSCTAMLEYVLAPKRLRAWLLQRDPLLQSLVSTCHLSAEECTELLAYYSVGGDEGATAAAGAAGESAPIERLPRPCHRLDKVTSGVLLLGVTQAAARRVGEALTMKTKQMEEVFLEQLPLLCQKDTGKMEDGTVQTFEVGALEELNVGVRKRYLARVHGCFPQRALQLLRLKGPTKEGAAARDDMRVTGDDLFVASATATSRDNSSADENGGKASATGVGPMVLLASPLMQYVFREDNTEEEGGETLHDPSAKKLREPLLQKAATLCQPLHHYSSFSKQDEGESLVHCVPLSGRMHQIRMHLSDWGHPIIGDVSYYAGERRPRQPVDPSAQQPHSSSTKDNEAPLFFCEEALPKTYRETFHSQDELCWECTGRLPVACFGGRNSSAIALHAWKYEMNHHLLVASDPVNADRVLGQTQIGQKEQQQPEVYQKHDSEEPPELCCSWGDAKQGSVEFVRRQGPTVVFSAPPPSWSQH